MRKITKVLVGYGISSDLNLISFDYPSRILEIRTSLRLPNSDKLDLIGTIQELTFLPIESHKTNGDERYFESKHIKNLNHIAILILEDGRVFENLGREHPEPSEVTSAKNYIQNVFGGRSFSSRFNNLYNLHKIYS